MENISYKETSGSSYAVSVDDSGMFDDIPDVSSEKNQNTISKGCLFKYDNCYYKLEQNGDLTFCSTGDATGKLIIPKTISVNGEEHPVATIGTIERCRYTYTDYHNDKRKKPTEYSGTIEVGAFFGSKVTECVFPPSIREIEEIIWGPSESIEHWQVRSIIEELEEKRKSRLKRISFSEESKSELTAINSKVFSNCELDMGTLKLPEGLRQIGAEAFAGSFLKVIIPSTIEMIEEKAFYNCSIKGMSLPEGLTHLGSNFVDLYHFTEKLEIPSTVKTIPQLEWTVGERWDVSKTLPTIIIHNSKKDVTVEKITSKYCNIDYVDASGNRESCNHWIRSLMFKLKKPKDLEDFNQNVVSAVVIACFLIFTILVFAVIGVLVGVGVLG